MISAIFQRKLRGFRVVELAAAMLLCVMMLGVYFAKTSAGGERARIDQVERRIAEEKSQIRMLDAEVAYLERPRRVGHLAETYLQMQPLKADREASVEALAVVAAKPVRPAPRPVEAPAT